MGGIGLSSTNLNRTPNTQYAHKIHTERTHTNTHIHMQTYICTETKTNNMQHTEQNTDTETNIPSQDNAQPQHTEHSAHNYRTYSLDYYHEYVAINNSNTIELYTISK